MSDQITPIVKALEALSTAIKTSTSITGTLKEQYGWNFPALSKDDIASFADNLARRLTRVDRSSISQKWSSKHVVSRLEAAATELPQYFWNGNGTEAFRAYTALLDWIEALFEDFFVQKIDWEKLQSDQQVPSALAKRVRNLDARIKTVTSGIEGLDEQVASIKAAHEAALALPTDIESLEEAKARVADLQSSAEKDTANIEVAAERVIQLVSQIEANQNESSQLVKNVHDAYSAATTVGLGGAFQQRATNLSWSMWVWVVGLLIALSAGSGFGLYRISLVERLIDRQAPTSIIWLNLVLAALSVAAPIWFAWLATKQVGHRFRLSEDYAFKASIARAYEGYRREAARLDPKFEQRLFETALQRLEEPPLRFVEHETPGSPWHESWSDKLRGWRHRNVASALSSTEGEDNEASK